MKIRHDSSSKNEYCPMNYPVLIVSRYYVFLTLIMADQWSMHLQYPNKIILIT